MTTEDEWKKKLSPECYHVCRQKGTEKPFQNKYWDCHDDGVYKCAACGQPLFHSNEKYDSGSGWPSFKRPIPSSTRTEKDFSLLPARIEVLCSRCGSHLGHVFDDGPVPTRKRFCINSAALNLERL